MTQIIFGSEQASKILEQDRQDEIEKTITFEEMEVHELISKTRITLTEFFSGKEVEYDGFFGVTACENPDEMDPNTLKLFKILYNLPMILDGVEFPADHFTLPPFNEECGI